MERPVNQNAQGCGNKQRLTEFLFWCPKRSRPTPASCHIKPQPQSPPNVITSVTCHTLGLQQQTLGILDAQSCQKLCKSRWLISTPLPEEGAAFAHHDRTAFLNRVALSAAELAGIVQAAEGCPSIFDLSTGGGRGPGAELALL